jgi:glucose/arabinose dehydrogenase
MSARTRRIARGSIVAGLALGAATVALGAAVGIGRAAPAPQAPACAPDNDGLTLPDGFCAVIVAEDLRAPRHIAVASNGDLFVSISGRGGPAVIALRDTNGDGTADVREEWGESGGTGIVLRGGYVYFAQNDAVVRYPIAAGSLTPSGPPETVVGDLPSRGGHTAKSIAIDDAGNLYVNIGSLTNSCQERDRQERVPGIDPCTELETRAGIWRFSADRPNQTEADGTRFATGLRNTVALRIQPGTGQLYGVVHGRDQLAQNWGFSTVFSAENPAEEMVELDQGDNFGWPYCFYSNDIGRKVLNPEYGGDGEEVGRCAGMKDPVIAFPGHWGPNDIEFYTGDEFPARYRGGAFIAFHGSWNRDPEPQGGYNIVFVPAANGGFSQDWEVFASGFAGADMSPRGATHRPTGVTMGPDGSLYIADDRGGTVWKIVHTG